MCAGAYTVNYCDTKAINLIYVRICIIYFKCTGLLLYLLCMHELQVYFIYDGQMVECPVETYYTNSEQIVCFTP